MNCDPCNQSPICSEDVKYSGPNLVCTTIETCDSMSTAFEKLNSKICTLQSTLVILQNQLNSYTTTTTTSSTSTTTSTSTSTTSTSTTSTSTTTSTTSTTTTVTTPSVFFSLQDAPGGTTGKNFSMHYRINGGAWNEFTVNFCITAPPYPGYNDYIIWSASKIGGLSPAWTIGAFIEIAVTDCVLSTGTNRRFGAGFNSGQFTTYCGKATPYGFTWNGGQNIYINVAITSGNTVAC